mmetsp:Transcript_33482/g.41039  ORF Transcript_33482/g.41039 Transcript_33482/m.41039 type:complete len:120 (+) Transcript_33482:39-398(+)
MSFTTALRCPTCTAPNDKKVKCPCRGIGPSFSPFTAAELGDLNTVVKFLEKYGRDVDKEDSGGYTMLHYAAQHNRAKVVEYLLQKEGKFELTLLWCDTFTSGSLCREHRLRKTSSCSRS